MHFVLIRFEDYNKNTRDVAVVRNKPSADRLIKGLQERFPSYRCGAFKTSPVKYIKNIPCE